MTIEWVFASDVSNGRDGIGLELWLDGELALLIFRDDTLLTRTVTLYRSELPVPLVNEAMQRFQAELWDFGP